MVRLGNIRLLSSIYLLGDELEKILCREPLENVSFLEECVIDLYLLRPRVHN